MAQVLQLRRGTTAQNDTFTGAAGEVTVDTDRESLRVHDGVTMGGKEIADLQTAVPLLPAASSVSGSDTVPVIQSGVARKATKTQILNGIVNANIDAAASIADTKLATISAAGKVSNSATTATSANTANSIVTRDSSGNFSAGTITASLNGNVTGSAVTLATGRTVSLTGDVTGVTGVFDGSANISAATTISNNAVTTAKILDSNVTSAKLAYDGGAMSGFRNRVINGGMRIDQRNSGASQTFTAAAALAYSVDRFYGYCTGANVLGQRIAGSGNNEFVYRFTGAASVTGIGFGTRLEATNTMDLAGSTATLSVRLANSVLTSVTWTVFYANTADTFGTLAIPTRTQIATGTFTVNSTLTRYSTQISMPSAATTGIEILFTVGAQTSGTWTIDEVQLEAGTVATPFEIRPLQTELALCQRYFFRYSPNAGNRFGPSFNTSTTQAVAIVPFPVPMRSFPTSVGTSGTAGDYMVFHGVTQTVASAVPAFGNASIFNCAVTATVASGLTAGQGSALAALTSSGFLSFSTEL